MTGGWKKLSQKVRKYGYRQLIFKLYRLPDGGEKEFTTYGGEGDQSVGVIAFTPDNQVIIARQFRPGPENVYDELPGGDVDPGENRHTAAVRELREETGYKAGSLDYIGSVCRDAYSNATAHYYIARDCVLVGTQMLDRGEFIEVVTISPQQLITNARERKMSDAGAVLLAYEHLQDMVQSKS